MSGETAHELTLFVEGMTGEAAEEMAGAVARFVRDWWQCEPQVYCEALDAVRAETGQVYGWQHTGEMVHPPRAAEVDPHQDMRKRLQPDAKAFQLAADLFIRYPAAEVVIVPLVLPGKVQGVWVAGQEVVTVPRVAFACVTRTWNRHLPDYGWARNAASDVAAAWLGGREGTVARVSIHRGAPGPHPVFEEPG